MELSKKIFSVAGIPVKIHASLLLLLIWIVFSSADGHFTNSLITFGFLMASITMHELAHALTAKHMGVRTKDVTLYPFGGIALLLDKLNPKQELLITAAGPASNILVAILIAANTPSALFGTSIFFTSSLGILFSINLALGIFNLIPAYPMDGGRLLRAGLQLLNVKSATKIATRTSQFICILLAFAAINYSNLLLLAVAIFVFMSASKEAVISQAQSVSSSMEARDVMIPLQSLETLSPSMTIEMAANFALKTAQTHFPVCLGTQFLGLVDRDSILHRSVSDIDQGYITEIMTRNIPKCFANDNLDQILISLEENACEVLLVEENIEPVGLIIKDQVHSLLLVKQVLKRNEELRQEDKDLDAI
jgi:Zn-dependent protease/predicted transcriptional regulator